MNKKFRTALVSLALFVTGACNAEMGYEAITPPQNTSTPDKVEVLEFFWYGCPHCNQLEPTMKQWDEEFRPDYVELVRAAPPLNPSWANHGRAFYAAEIMNVLDKFHEPMFKALHVDKRRLNSLEDIASFAGENGIDADKFLATMKSFAVETKLMRARQQAIAMGITGVPAVVVNGKYKTSASLAGSYPQMMEVINQLAEEENNRQ